MFIIETIKYEEAKGTLREKYEKFFNLLGEVPPHVELLGSIDEELLDRFILNITYFLNHPKINPKILPFLRLYISNQEGCKYCKSFNTKLLEKMNFSEEEIDTTMSDLTKAPFEEKDKTFLLKAIKSIYEPNSFNENDLQELYDFGWSDRDIFDIIDYVATFKGRGKMIDAYLKE